MQTGIPVQLAARPRLAKQRSSEVSREALTLHGRARSQIPAQSWSSDGGVRSAAGSLGGRRLDASGLAGAAVTQRQVAHPAGKVASTLIQDEHGHGGERNGWNGSPNAENHISFGPDDVSSPGKLLVPEVMPQQRMSRCSC